jgi:D-beta-D-heptose 7-phosphate kinase/D-beta-D-heptose 1-phosphate adenosyltransferase
MGLVLVRDQAAPYEIDTIAQEIFDVSGAGDTVSAVFTLSLAVGATPEESATLANCAAARVIREVGTATLDPEELKEVVEFWGQQE